MYLEYCEILLATTPVRYQSAALALSMGYGAAFVSAHILDTISVRVLKSERLPKGRISCGTGLSVQRFVFPYNYASGLNTLSGLTIVTGRIECPATDPSASTLQIETR